MDAVMRSIGGEQITEDMLKICPLHNGGGMVMTPEHRPFCIRESCALYAGGCALLKIVERIENDTDDGREKNED